MSTAKIVIEMDRNQDLSYTAAFSDRGRKYFDGISEVKDPVQLAQEVGEYVTDYLIKKIQRIAGTEGPAE